MSTYRLIRTTVRFTAGLVACFTFVYVLHMPSLVPGL